LSCNKQFQFQYQDGKTRDNHPLKDPSEAGIVFSSVCLWVCVFVILRSRTDKNNASQSPYFLSRISGTLINV